MILDTQRHLFAQRVSTQDQIEQPGYQGKWDQAELYLLQFGGEAVVPPVIVDHWSVTAGKAIHAFAGGYIAMKPGDPSACHINVAKLMLAGEIQAIATGYGLSDDGLWRQHSWGIDDKGSLVETTEDREIYVGLHLNFIESVKFILDEDLGDDFVDAMENVPYAR